MKCTKSAITSCAEKARMASRVLASLPRQTRDKALCDMAASLRAKSTTILRANQRDVTAAKAKKRSKALIDRLTLTKKRISDMARSLEEIALMDDPVGDIFDMHRRPNGLMIGKMRVPIGVVGIIYEARPNVTSDCVGLCLKSGNSIILRGGSEAFHSNTAIVKVLRSALPKEIPAGALGFIETTDRKAVEILLRLNEYIDLIIPRGGEGLIREVTEKSTIPVIKHYKGICHVYVDADADATMALRIAVNAKVQRPGVCNAMETLLVNEKIARKFLPVVGRELKKHKVKLCGCAKTRKHIPGVKLATAEDWKTEYLDLILSIKVVVDMTQAIAHINTYGSQHSDAIVTENYANALRFLREVDSAAVYVNASTRFTDGGQFGLGAEMGISTDKLHARGPMGIKELTTYKYVTFGNGQIRE